MGITAPTGYLACNGQVVNIADYSDLADYFLAQFGSKNKFGGNGTTTFGIPDLRGEFLRGTGTNSHGRNGSGSDVGTHQDSTRIAGLAVTSNGKSVYLGYNNYADPQPADIDNYISADNATTRIVLSGSQSTTETVSRPYYAHPTNTSILYCIKY